MYLLVDIGGTKMRVARSADLSSFDTPVILDTPQAYEQGVALLVETLRALLGGATPQAIAVGMPGSISADRKTTFNRRNLAGWSGKPLIDYVSRVFPVPITLENDTAMVGLGEAVYGAGGGAPIVAYLTVSTGVNGVRIVDGSIDRSAYGFEIGGQYVPQSAEITFENLISGTAIQERYGKHPKDIAQNDPLWEELALIVAYGVNNSMLHWSPDRFVLGGSMFNEIGISVESVAKHVAVINKKYSAPPEIVHSSLGDLGGLYGGLALLKQRA